MSKEEALRLIKHAAETGETRLSLSGQKLTELPPEVFELKNLTALWLDGNQLSSLSPEIVQLPKLKELWLEGNPLVSPPIEIADQGISAIREYFAEVEGETKELAEVKVILVGEGASGKTSLTRCLRGQCFNEHEETTHGIRIKDWQIDTPERLIRCKLWDFGGQEIMHATHQFFLSRRCLYVLVLDGRRDERPEYWLRYIESFGDGSPVLVVLNKCDANPGFDLNRPFLQEKYPFIKGFWRTSCNTGQGIEAFRNALLEELCKVPMTKTRWPASWFRVKSNLEQTNEPRITYESFEEICKQAGVDSETSQAVLADFLHDLGCVIHFHDFELYDNYILDPKWVTGAVYKIINAPLLAERRGLLLLDDLKEILQWRGGERYKYYPGDYVYIIELMKKFELCYELNDKEVLIPQLLGVAEPSFTFDEQGALRLSLHYEDFLPPSIMPRFIVKRHQEIKDELRWRTGVVLANPQLDARAVIKADNEARRIHIAVTGKERKAYLSLIWLTLREINSGFDGLKVSERIPIPDDPARSVPYETLLTCAGQGIEKFVPEGSKKAYSVIELLDTVPRDQESDGERVLEMLWRHERDIADEKANAKLFDHIDLSPSFVGITIDMKALFRECLLRYRKWRDGR